MSKEKTINPYLPESIPYYPHIKQKFGLTDKQTLLYGFIRFYMANSLSSSKIKNQFFFSNKKLAEIIGFKTETGVSLAMKKLKDVGLVEIKIVAKDRKNTMGGKIRFVTDIVIDSRKINKANKGTTTNVKEGTLTNVKGIKNKVTENKNNYNFSLSKKSRVSKNKSNKDKTYKKNYEQAYPLSQFLEEYNHLKEILTEAVKYYIDCYDERVGGIHPNIKVSQWVDVENSLNVFQDEWELTEENWVDLINQWFKKLKGTDFNIIHFATGDIMQNCMFNTRLY